MNIMSLNMRGLGDNSKRKRLAKIINSGNFDLVCLQETKREFIEDYVVENMWGNQLIDWIALPSSGLSGGLLMMWKRGLWVVKSNFSGHGFIGVCVEFKSKLFFFVNVYAPCNTAGRRLLWETLYNLKYGSSAGEWCLVGDFNAVSNREERTGRSENWGYIDMVDFNAFVNEMNLIDPPLHGNKFTYFCSDGIAASRLDRFLVSDGIMNLWQVKGQRVGKRDISDHCPIWLECSNLNWGPKPFRFNNCWLEHDGFKSFIVEEWKKIQITGRKAYVIKEKLKIIRESLKKWNKEVFGWLDLNIENIVADMNELDRGIEEGCNLNVVVKKKEANALFWQQLMMKESLLKQKSRLRWIKEGDSNTKFFHSCLQDRRRKNQILSLQVEGRCVEQVGEVKMEVRRFFEEGFKEASFSRPVLGGIEFQTLGSEENSFLVAPFSEEEIKDVVWSCDGNKCPGPDGFNLRFIKECWEFVKDDIVEFLQEFQITGVLPKAITASFLALIPKVNNPQNLKEYRPICLIGCLYKILSKVLASRLKKVIAKLISPCQSAFISGRQILDGVLMINEVVDLAKRRKDECLLFKVDFEKAYDSVSWSFLTYMLNRMGFDKRWIGWIQACVFSSSMSVLVNGSPTDEFTAHKGLRQGDPLSPFLFLIVAQGLSGLVQKASQVGNFDGYQVADGLNLSLLQFADDTILLGKGSWKNLWSIKTIFRSFELVSGLRVNFHKSKLIGLNINEGFLESASIFLSCCMTLIPFKFLGVLVGANPRRRSTWKPVVDSMRAKLSCWRGRNLSIGGKVTLINSVLSSLPLYLFSFFKAPKVVIKELTQIQRDFLWGSHEEERKICWVSWEDICKPKKEGGLGVKNLEVFNISLLAKWKWRCIHDHNALWRDLLAFRYGNLIAKQTCSLDRSWGTKDSIWWRDLMLLEKDLSQNQNFFQRAVSCDVGDGQSILFWYNKWLGSEPLKDAFPELFAISSQQLVSVGNAGSWRRDQWTWGLTWKRQLNPNEEESLHSLETILVDVHLVAESHDRWKWSLHNSKLFTVSSCYSFAMSLVNQTQMNSDILDILSIVWKVPVPSKVALFCWRLLLDRLPTKDNLIRRNVVINNSRCSLCDSCDENVVHLFFHCDFSKCIWKEILSWIGIVDVIAVGGVQHFWEYDRLLKYNTSRNKVPFMFWLATLWIIWQVRNNSIFKEEEKDIPKTINQIKHICWAWFMGKVGGVGGSNISDWWNSPFLCSKV